VVSCGAPGAGGVNRAWRPEASGFDGIDPAGNPVHIPPAPTSYEIIDQCPSQLLVRSSTLQGRERGGWRTFDDTRSDGKGRWHATYVFSGRPGTYPIRLKIRRQTSYPFELGYSRALTVRVS
jgi:hypothetical protein